MRFLMNVIFPNEPFNTVVRHGSASAMMGKILESIKPEAAYFTEQDGHRSGIFIVNIDNPSQIPALAEPWFLQFNAQVKLHAVMGLEDLGRANLTDLGKKWG